MVKNRAADTLNSRDFQEDTLFQGSLSCRQYRNGYRFSIDSVLLAHFPEIRKNERILDLGTGSGVIGLILCYRYQDIDISVTGIERQPDLAALARKNVVENGYETMFSIKQGDIGDCRSFIEPESYTLVVANPPFYAPGTGRASSDPEAMTARHQDEAGLAPFVEAAAFAVKNRGMVVFIYPADRVAEMFHCFKKRRIAPKSVQFIYSYPQCKKASLVIVAALKNGGAGTEILQPCYIYQFKGGAYSKPVQSMFHPR